MVEMAEMDWNRVNQLGRGVAQGQADAEELAKESKTWPDADEITALATEAATLLDRLDDAMINYLEG
jgi:hypothetical protein